MNMNFKFAFKKFLQQLIKFWVTYCLTEALTIITYLLFLITKMFLEENVLT